MHEANSRGKGVFNSLAQISYAQGTRWVIDTSNTSNNMNDFHNDSDDDNNDPLVTDFVLVFCESVNQGMAR